MCGIVGFKDRESIQLDTIFQNAIRGTYSFGYIHLDDLHFEKKRIDIHDLNPIISTIDLDKPTLLHFRQPTSTDREVWVEEENYPLESSNYLLMGNGVINARYFSSIKDENNNNDLYYILKKLDQEGFEYLQKVEGCFSFAIVEKQTKKVYLIRKDYPLYVNDRAFSSVKFPNSTVLEHGVLWEWGTDTKINLHLSSVYA